MENVIGRGLQEGVIIVHLLKVTFEGRETKETVGDIKVTTGLGLNVSIGQSTIREENVNFRFA